MMENQRRVITVIWKKNSLPISTEVYSNLKIFCQSYPSYNYHTLNNYLSKAKQPFENDEVRIERSTIKNRPTPSSLHKIAPIVKRMKIHEANDYERDLDYWLSKTIKERAIAMQFIISQSISDNQRLDKTHVIRKRIKE
jgi:hypothetical protein